MQNPCGFSGRKASLDSCAKFPSTLAAVIYGRAGVEHSIGMFFVEVFKVLLHPCPGTGYLGFERIRRNVFSESPARLLCHLGTGARFAPVGSSCSISSRVLSRCRNEEKFFVPATLTPHRDCVLFGYKFLHSGARCLRDAPWKWNWVPGCSLEDLGELCCYYGGG